MTKDLIESQRQRISFLEEEKKVALKAFDLIQELGSFAPFSDHNPSQEELVQDICRRAAQIIPFESCAVYLVEDERRDFVFAGVHPENDATAFNRKVEALIKDGSFASALKSDDSLIISEPNGQKEFLLHPIASPYSVKGVFVGLLPQCKDRLFDTTLKLFSIYMFSAVNTLENFEVHNQMLNQSQDLERKVQQRTLELADAFDRLDTTLDGMQAGVMVVEAEGHKIVDANPKALEMLGMSWEQLIGKECFEVICSALRGRCPIVDLGFGEDNGEYLIERRDGVRIPIQKAVSRVMIEGKLHIVENFIDITEQKKLAQLKEDVDRIMRHDLKSPLNGIIGLPDVLLLDGDDNLTESQREILEYIQASGYKLLNMINLSLDLFKMETGAYDYQPAVADFYSIGRSVKKDLSDLVSYKKIEIREQFEGQDVDQDFSLDIRCDELLTYSLLSNLLKNAVEASPVGGIITVNARRYSGKTILSIHNQGAVPKDIRGCFFEKYVTADKSGGTGLGTYSASLITETMGGKISFDSSDDEGTSIFIELPGI